MMINQSYYKHCIYYELTKAFFRNSFKISIEIIYIKLFIRNVQSSTVCFTELSVLKRHRRIRVIYKNSSI